MHCAPPGTGEPGKAPASKISRAEAAVNVPSFLAPSLTLIVVPVAYDLIESLRQRIGSLTVTETAASSSTSPIDAAGQV